MKKLTKGINQKSLVNTASLAAGYALAGTAKRFTPAIVENDATRNLQIKNVILVAGGLIGAGASKNPMVSAAFAGMAVNGGVSLIGEGIFDGFFSSSTGSSAQRRVVNMPTASRSLQQAI